MLVVLPGTNVSSCTVLVVWVASGVTVVVDTTGSGVFGVVSGNVGDGVVRRASVVVARAAVALVVAMVVRRASVVVACTVVALVVVVAMVMIAVVAGMVAVMVVVHAGSVRQDAYDVYLD